MEAIAVRHGQPADKEFIFGTWLRSYKHSSDFAKRISNDVFFSTHHKIVELILAKPNTEVLIAHPVDEPNVILGYVVLERIPNSEIVHFVYVKKAFRMMGIASYLFKGAGLYAGGFNFTHWTTSVNHMFHKLDNVTYNPYLL